MFYFFWGASIGMTQLGFSESLKLSQEEYVYEDGHGDEDIGMEGVVYG